MLEVQGVGDNLGMSLIHAARGMLAVEKVSLQLFTLERSMHELQRSTDVLAQERDQAVRGAELGKEEADQLKVAVEQAKTEAVQAKAEAAESAAEQLAVERKRREDVEAKAGGLKFELETRTAELLARNNDLQNNLEESVREIEAAKETMTSILNNF